MSEVVALSFRIKGSEPEPYSVGVTVTGPTLTIGCTCMAGALRQWCKHKMALVTGDTASLVSGNPDDVSRLLRLIPQTAAATLINEVIQAERDAEAAKQRVKLSRNALSRAVGMK